MKRTSTLSAAILASCLFSAAVFAENPASVLNCLANAAQSGSLSCDKGSAPGAASAEGSGSKSSAGLKPGTKRHKGKPKRDRRKHNKGDEIKKRPGRKKPKRDHRKGNKGDEIKKHAGGKASPAR